MISFLYQSLIYPFFLAFFESRSWQTESAMQTHWDTFWSVGKPTSCQAALQNASHQKKFPKKILLLPSQLYSPNQDLTNGRCKWKQIVNHGSKCYKNLVPKPVPPPSKASTWKANRMQHKSGSLSSSRESVLAVQSLLANQ